LLFAKPSSLFGLCLCGHKVLGLAQQEAEEEVRLAGILLDAASGKVHWSAYRDQTAEELKSLIEAKLAGQAVQPSAPPLAILSLLEALKESVQVENGKETSSPTKEKASRKRTRRTA
jgi:non-homologous end joining protein Ku